MSVGIVGAGLSGLIAGRALQEAGLGVTLFDKGRRPGGRANTREHGPYRFDHGAQYFTVRDSAVSGLLAEWRDAGVVAEWDATFVRIRGEVREPAKPATRWVGVPGMIGLALHLAKGLDVRSGVRIVLVERHDAGWMLVDSDGERHGPFDQVLAAVPAPQAVPLLGAAPSLRARASGVEMAPCWAGMFVFESPVELGFDGAFVSDGPISWLARDSSKPGRGPQCAWVVHASPEWTRAEWESEPGAVAELLLTELRSRFGPLPAAVFTRAHRWAYALGGDGPSDAALFDPALGIGACGDWCVGGRVEGALLSGAAAAARIVDALRAGPVRGEGAARA